jgi:cobalt-zinc-cadmium efflux system membrane fusion protein
MRLCLLSIVLAAITFVGCGDKRGDPVAAKTPIAKTNPDEVVLPSNSPKLREIKVETVATADAPSDEVGSPGKVEVNPNRVAHVLLPLQGRIAKVYVKIGDAVRQGQTLLELESPDADLAMSTYLQAGAALTQAKSVAAKSQADVDRTRDLFENNAVAKKDLLNAEAMSTQAKAAVEQAEAALQQTLRRLEILGLKPGAFGQHVEVKAPVSGKVLEMTIVPGEYRNDTSSPVLTIADLSTVWVTSDVPESSIRMVRKGERVDIELAAYPGEVFRGRVAQIADTVDPQTRTIKVRAEIQNLDGRLRPEMFARIRLISGTQVRPVIPVAAVLQGESGTYVVREVEPGRFRQTPVTLGVRLGEKVAVSQGLKSGDHVVTDGVLLVRN